MRRGLPARISGEAWPGRGGDEYDRSVIARFQRAAVVGTGALDLAGPTSSEESIPGDLLEEYREAERPSRGQWRADLWYLRQVVGFLCRLTWMFAVFNAAALILRAILDTFAPPGFAPHSYQLRSSASTYAAVITFLLAGCYAGYRMGRANSGTLAAFTASAVGHALALGFQVVLFYAVIRHDPAAQPFYVTGGWGEAGLPVIITSLPRYSGLLGGLCGKYVSRLRGRPSRPILVRERHSERPASSDDGRTRARGSPCGSLARVGVPDARRTTTPQ